MVALPERRVGKDDSGSESIGVVVLLLWVWPQMEQGGKLRVADSTQRK